MDTLLLIGYVILFAAMLVMMEHNIRHRKKWLPLWLFELLSAVGAFVVMMLANAAPGTGMMPGISNIGIVIYSMGAAAAFGTLLIISLIIGLIRRSNQN